MIVRLPATVLPIRLLARSVKLVLAQTSAIGARDWRPRRLHPPLITAWRAGSSTLAGIASVRTPALAPLPIIKVAEYYGCSSGLPAENASDLTSAVWAAWAEHYEQARPRFPHYAYYAAGAWALAGDTTRVFAAIQHLVDYDANARAAWFEGWWFNSLHGTEVFSRSAPRCGNASDSATPALKAP